MKKSLAILLILAITLTSALVGCSKKGSSSSKSDNATTETSKGLNNDTEIDFVEEAVTDKNGKEVTDQNGNTKTTEVPVIVETDKKGTTHYYRVNDDGSKGPEVKTEKSSKNSKKSKSSKNNKKSNNNNNKKIIDNEEDNKNKQIDNKKEEEKKVSNTDPYELNTTNRSTPVPSTSQSGKEVIFSSKDQNIIINMLEVPYLYTENYENSQGVPIDIATHAAIWMAQKDGLEPSTLSSATIVLGLFKYFGQTVVNFKSECNSRGNNSNIVYNPDGTFNVSSFENKQQEVVKLQKIESLGNAYYKVTATVKNAGSKTKVTAVFQKNKLDLDLGFSLKAIKWS